MILPYFVFYSILLGFKEWSHTPCELVIIYTLILILLLILSIFAIVRIPINQFTIPVILVIVVTYIIIEMVKVEKLSNKKS